MSKLSFRARYNCTEEEYFNEFMRSAQDGLTVQLARWPSEITPLIDEALKQGRLYKAENADGTLTFKAN